jgi:hypothetical protein
MRFWRDELLLVMMILFVCPRPIPKDPAQRPSYPHLYVGYPFRHGSVDHSPVDFPYFGIVDVRALLINLSIGAGAGFILGGLAFFAAPVPKEATSPRP